MGLINRFLHLAFLVAGPVLATTGKLNLYWGQYGSDRMSTYCDMPNVDMLTLSFVNSAPDGKGVPGTNFAGHCGADVTFVVDNVSTNLLMSCQSIWEDIPVCQGKGVKIMLSIGGAYDPTTSDYTIPDDATATAFANFLVGAFGPKLPSWTGPRPFDPPSGPPNVIDGFDIDVEIMFAQQDPWITFIDGLRSGMPSALISGAPQCPTAAQYMYMGPMIQAAQFDFLNIQFYNNPACDFVNKNSGFNYLAWEGILTASTNSKDAKIYIGLPASLATPSNPGGAAGSGYIPPDYIHDLVCTYGSRATFGGVTLWDADRAASNMINGYSLLEYVGQIVEYGCDEIPIDLCLEGSSTSSSMSVTQSSSAVTSSTSSTTTTTSSGHTTSSTITTSSIAPSTTSSHSTTSSSSSVPATTTSSAIVTSQTAAASTTSSHLYTTSTLYTTTTYTITKCPATVTNCPVGQVTTVTVAIATTVCPIEEAQATSTSSTASSPAYIVSTTYSTTTYTITKCPVTVTNCPVGKVTTEPVAVLVTIYPTASISQVAAVQQYPAPASSLLTVTVPAMGTGIPYPVSSSYSAPYTVPTAAAPRNVVTGVGLAGALAGLAVLVQAL